MSATYLMTDELSAKIEYDVRTIRQRLKDSVLLEGTHHVRAFGGRKILSVWEAIERDMRVFVGSDALSLHMANGKPKFTTSTPISTVLKLQHPMQSTT